MWAYGRGQTDTQTRVTTIHFASSTTQTQNVIKICRTRTVTESLVRCGVPKLVPCKQVTVWIAPNNVERSSRVSEIIQTVGPDILNHRLRVQKQGHCQTSSMPRPRPRPRFFILVLSSRSRTVLKGPIRGYCVCWFTSRALSCAPVRCIQPRIRTPPPMYVAGL